MNQTAKLCMFCLGLPATPKRDQVGKKLCMLISVGSGTESDSDESVPELEEQDSTQATTQQAQVRKGMKNTINCISYAWAGL